jgi:hypothetical protein
VADYPHDCSIGRSRARRRACEVTTRRDREDPRIAPVCAWESTDFVSTAFLHFGLDATGEGPSPEELYADRDRHFVRCNAVEQISIRASLLTSNPRIVAALQLLRAIAEDPLRPMNAARREEGDAPTPADAFRKLHDPLSGAFDELESATRQVTAVDLAR